MTRIAIGDVSWERMIRAVEKVRDRLQCAAAALAGTGILYAVTGGNAVAAWVSRVDEAAVRNTRDVDILIRRRDLDAVRQALGRAGFVYRHAPGVDMFLDDPEASARDSVHIVMAGEKVRDQYLLPAPDVTESERTGDFRMLSLDALVRMKLTSFRDRDRMHLRDGTSPWIRALLRRHSREWVPLASRQCRIANRHGPSAFGSHRALVIGRDPKS